MKNYTITVNGNVYDVTVEEGSGVAAPVKAAPKAAPKAAAQAVASATAPAAAPAAGGEGSVKIEAGAAGKVYAIPVKVGQTVKSGDAIVVLEAMKMEIPMVAPQDGTVASIQVSVGNPVEAGDLLATLN
jgi:biotin carboxyl carrier protein